MLNSADLFQNWSIDEIVLNAPFAKDDLYESLFFYFQNVLWQFCDQISKLKIDFQFFQIDALRLPNFVKQYKINQRSFDRIEVQLPKRIFYFIYHFLID